MMSNTYKMMEVSNSHMTADDADTLEEICEEISSLPVTAIREPPPINVGNLAFGFAIVLVEPSPEEAKQKCAEQGYHLSDAFWNVLVTAKKDGYRCLIFDREAAEGDFESFSW